MFSSSLWSSEQPNVIIIFTDDQGYADLGSYGSDSIKTPNLDALAHSGIRFTDFYVSNSVCSASRAALLTGRSSVKTHAKDVYWPDERGLDAKEELLPELLKKVGYNTAMFGKWHLGDNVDTLPGAQGFDYYYGIPYSNDMHLGVNLEFSEHVKFTRGYSLTTAQELQAYYQENGRPKGIDKNSLATREKFKVPLVENSKMIEFPAEQESLTQRYFDGAIEFIENKNHSPFFIYLAPAMPHVPLYASKKFLGKSDGGLYGDTIEELDWYVGKLLRYLESSGLRENTLIVYASDNGPWLRMTNFTGSAKPLREGKKTFYEGGIRVPGIMSWPAQYPEGKTSAQVVSTMDILPTIAYHAKVPLPDMSLDGANISELLALKSPKQRTIYFTSENKVMAVRFGNWKYVVADKNNLSTAPAENDQLFNLKTDISETKNVIAQYPKVASEIRMMLLNYQNQP